MHGGHIAEAKQKLADAKEGAEDLPPEMAADWLEERGHNDHAHAMRHHTAIKRQQEDKIRKSVPFFFQPPVENMLYWSTPHGSALKDIRNQLEDLGFKHITDHTTKRDNGGISIKEILKDPFDNEAELISDHEHENSQYSAAITFAPSTDEDISRDVRHIQEIFDTGGSNAVYDGILALANKLDVRNSWAVRMAKKAAIAQGPDDIKKIVRSLHSESHRLPEPHSSEHGYVHTAIHHEDLDNLIKEAKNNGVKLSHSLELETDNPNLQVVHLQGENPVKLRELEHKYGRKIPRRTADWMPEAHGHPEIE